MVMVPFTLWQRHFADEATTEMVLPILNGQTMTFLHTVDYFTIKSVKTQKDTKCNIVRGADEFLFTFEAAKELGLVVEVNELISLQHQVRELQDRLAVIESKLKVLELSLM